MEHPSSSHAATDIVSSFKTNVNTHNKIASLCRILFLGSGVYCPVGRPKKNPTNSAAAATRRISTALADDYECTVTSKYAQCFPDATDCVCSTDNNSFLRPYLLSHRAMFHFSSSSFKQHSGINNTNSLYARYYKVYEKLLQGEAMLYYFGQ